MSGRSISPGLDIRRRSLSPRSPISRRGRSYSRSRSSSSRSYSRSRSRSRSYSRRRRSRSRSRSPYRRSSSRSYHGRYYSRSPPPSHHRRSPLSPSRRYRSRSPPPPRRRPSKGCRVYVGNLPYEVTWHQLKDFMREAGQVVFVDILKTSSGRSKGCGIVEYRYPEDTKRAIHILHKAKFMGRPVYIREDRDYENSGPLKDPRDAPDDCRLLVSNLPLNASWQDMKDLFRDAGRVLHTDIHTDVVSRRPNGHGTVIFDCPETAKIAIDMFNGYEWQGSKLEVCEGQYVDKSKIEAPNEIFERSPHVNSRLPSLAETSVKYEPSKSYTPVTSSPISTMPTPTTVPPSTTTDASPHYQSMYRYGLPETAQPVNHLPPPPPMYTHMTLVGGPAAHLPSHGHNQIFVNNLPFSTTWQDLIDLFRHVGPVRRSEILTMNGHPKGSGFVRFEDAATCERAIEKFHGYMYGGRHLDIRLDKYSTTT